jgi:hypothetical protein
MDMSPAYLEEVRAHCPQVAVVYDLFHVVAKYGREGPIGWPAPPGPTIRRPERGAG